MKAPIRFLLCVAIFAVLPRSSAVATVLTFDDDPPITNSENINQAYGDAVTSTTMPGNFLYDENGEGFTPNIAVDYGPLAPVNASPDLWSTGYGDLTNILFKDADGFDYLQVTFTADPGFRVRLHSWDMAAFGAVFSSDPTIDSVRVLDSGGNELLALTNVSISETTHTSFDYAANPFVDDVLVLEFNSGNLGGLSDDIAFDNIVFSQIPEPGAMLLLLLGACELAAWMRRSLPTTGRG
jgi:hypothetical protein